MSDSNTFRKDGNLYVRTDKYLYCLSGDNMTGRELTRLHKDYGIEEKIIKLS